MASATDVREWAKSEGIEIGDKGRIKASITERYEAEHPGGPPEAGGGPPEGDDGGGDYDDGVTEADFPAAPGGAAEPAAREPQQPAAEQRPRQVAKARKGGRTFSERLWGGGGTKAKRPAKKQPRVSLKGFAEDMFLDLAWTFQGLPPLEKVLYLQAPLAGQVVEDAAKGTIVDAVLQPAARFDRQFKSLEALTAPAWVAAIMLRGRKDDKGEYSPETKLMFSGLRHSLLSMSRLAEVDFEKLKEKSEDLRTASGQIDAMIAWLFEMPELTEDQMKEMAAQQAARAAANGQ
jgi:hypothetical protein